MAPTVWPLPGEAWLQSAEGNRFERAAADGSALKTGLRADVALGAKTRANACVRADCGFFPRAFTHCPHCGHALATREHATTVWQPPFGHDAGLTPSVGTRIANRRMLLAPGAAREREPQQVFTMPTPGEYAFVVDNFSSHAPVVLAINTLGGCYVSSLADDDNAHPWFALAADTASRKTSLSARQFAVGLVRAARTTLLVPTDEGVGAITPDARNLTLDYAIAAPGRVAGGMADIAGLGIFALQESTDGYALLAFDLLGKLASRTGAAAGAPANQLFDAPLCYGLRGDIFWVGELGYFHAAKVDRQGRAMTLRWCAWPAGYRAVRAAGCAHIGDSTTSHIGDSSVWQLGYNGSQYAYLALGSAPPQPVDVPRMTSGKLVFHLADRLHRNQAPWEAAPVSTGPDKDDVIFPLLENASDNQYLAVRVNRGDNETIRALLASQAEQQVNVLFYDGQTETTWRTTMTQPWKTNVFFHGRSLFLHHPGATKLYRFLLAE